MLAKLTPALIGVGALALSACVIVDADVDEASYTDRTRGERLYAASVDARDGVVTIRAASNGCTQASSFDPDIDRRGDRFVIAFDRVQQDYCRANLPDGVELSWTLESLGLPSNADIRIANPIGS